MTERFLQFDLNRCFGCYTCEVACKQEHDIPVGVRWIKVTQVGPFKAAGKLRMHFIPRLCIHCKDPSCQYVCPVHAITKLPGGIVEINEKRCIGCEYCIPACPLGAIAFNAEEKKASKCNLCIDRIDKGLNPACVDSCPSRAIKLVGGV